MSRKNFKVDTATNGQTAKQDKKHIFTVKKTNAPTGKIVTKEERENRRKAREEQFKTFRINALKRRAKRMGLSEEDTKKKVEELINQLNTPNSYTVLMMFNPNNAKLLYAALDKEGIVCRMRSPINAKEDQDSFCWVDADQETLGTLREIAPPGTKIYPYVKKMPPVLKTTKPKKEKKPSNNKHPIKGVRWHERRKRVGIARMSKKHRQEFKEKVKQLKSALKAQKKATGKTVPIKSKKASTGKEKASTAIKQAA